MAEGWTIHEAAAELHLSECRVRQLVREKRLGATLIKGKHGPELCIDRHPAIAGGAESVAVLARPPDVETLARMVLAQAESIRDLERRLDGRGAATTVLIQAEKIVQLKKQATRVATCMDRCPIGQACRTVGEPRRIDARSNCG